MNTIVKIVTPKQARLIGTKIVIEKEMTAKDKQKLRLQTHWKYYGIKINKTTLDLKNATPQTVIDLLGLQDSEYVIGFDEQLCKEKIPHYHIHFRDERTLDALQAHKKRHMPNWGLTTKLYPPQKREENFECWCGYAVKENFVAHNKLKDILLVEKEAHTQKAYKQSQLNYGALQEEKREAKKDIQAFIYKELDDMELVLSYEFFPVAVQITTLYRDNVKVTPIRSQIEKLTWDYLLDRKHKTITNYVYWLYDKR